MQLELAPATEEDRDWLDQLRRDVYRDLFFATWGGWDEARHLRHVEACWNQGSIQIVRAQGKRVGMLQLQEAPETLEIPEIQIQPDHQNRGIGTRLLLDTIARAKTTGKRVVLSTGLMNTRAVELYIRLGFCEIRRSESKVFMEHSPS